tara:strand:- start:284 stop:568 length:285 start_codon:yes stop_codon:yes gene_type:complete
LNFFRQNSLPRERKNERNFKEVILSSFGSNFFFFFFSFLTNQRQQREVCWNQILVFSILLVCVCRKKKEEKKITQLREKNGKEEVHEKRVKKQE